MPAVDLIDADVSAYWSVVQVPWSWLSDQAVLRLAVVGKIFRAIDAIQWELPKTNWLELPCGNMAFYWSYLAEAFQKAGWES